MRSLMNDPEMAKIMNDGLNAPPNSTKAKKAKDAFMAVSKAANIRNQPGIADGQGGAPDGTVPTPPPAPPTPPASPAPSPASNVTLLQSLDGGNPELHKLLSGASNYTAESDKTSTVIKATGGNVDDTLASLREYNKKRQAQLAQVKAAGIDPNKPFDPIQYAKDLAAKKVNADAAKSTGATGPAAPPAPQDQPGSTGPAAPSSWTDSYSALAAYNTDAWLKNYATLPKDQQDRLKDIADDLKAGLPKDAVLADIFNNVDKIAKFTGWDRQRIQDAIAPDAIRKTGQIYDDVYESVGMGQTLADMLEAQAGLKDTSRLTWEYIRSKDTAVAKLNKQIDEVKAAMAGSNSNPFTNQFNQSQLTFLTQLRDNTYTAYTNIANDSIARTTDRLNSYVTAYNTVNAMATNKINSMLTAWQTTRTADKESLDELEKGLGSYIDKMQIGMSSDEMNRSLLYRNNQAQELNIQAAINAANNPTAPDKTKMNITGFLNTIGISKKREALDGSGKPLTNPTTGAAQYEETKVPNQNMSWDDILGSAKANYVDESTATAQFAQMMQDDIATDADPSAYISWMKKNFAGDNEQIYQMLVSNAYQGADATPYQQQVQATWNRLWPSIMNGLRQKESRMIQVKSDAEVEEMRKAVTSVGWFGGSMNLQDFKAKYGKKFSDNDEVTQAAYDFLRGSKEKAVTASDLKTGVSTQLAGKSAGVMGGAATYQANPK